MTKNNEHLTNEFQETHEDTLQSLSTQFVLTALAGYIALMLLNFEWKEILGEGMMAYIVLFIAAYMNDDSTRFRQ